VGAAAAFVSFAIGATWLLASGRLRRHENKRFRLTLDETRPLTVIAPEEFSDEVAATTPIPLPRDDETLRVRAS
jgi:hypothetical protein